VLLPAYISFRSFGSRGLFNDYTKEDLNRWYIEKPIDCGLKNPDFAPYEITDKEYEKKAGESIMFILGAIGKESALSLVNRTHCKKSAWEVFYNEKNKNDEKVLDVIMKELIHHKYFIKEYDERRR
jgi:uncharacterized phage-associated protein